MSPEVSGQDVRMKKRQVINHRSRSVSHSAFCDPGGILTPNPQSRNLMRYTVAPRSHFESTNVVRTNEYYKEGDNAR